jgi:hypothetical protein
VLSNIDTTDMTTVSLFTPHKHIDPMKGGLLVCFNIKTSRTCIKEPLSEEFLLLGWSSTSAAYHTVLISTLLHPHHPHNFPSTGTSTT